MRSLLAYLAFGLGASVSLLNCYLSWLRMPLLRAIGRSPHWVSGFPLIGSLLLAVSAVLLWEVRGIAWSALALAALDTGGIHWLIARQLWHARRSGHEDRGA